MTETEFCMRKNIHTTQRKLLQITPIFNDDAFPVIKALKIPVSVFEMSPTSV